MTDDANTLPVPGWFWAVAVVALLWAVAGCYAYLSQVSMEVADMQALPAAQRDIWMAMPAWVTGAYAAAVWVGLTGAVGLLLRRRWARTAYIVSLAAVLVQFGWTFIATDILNSVGLSAIWFPLCIIAIGALLVWFSGAAIRKGWLL
jgi:hypothetical protein